MARNNYNAAFELNLGGDSSSETDDNTIDSPQYSPTGSPLPNMDGVLMHAGEISSSAPSSTTDEEPLSPTYSPAESPVPSFDDDLLSTVCSSNSTTYTDYSNSHTVCFRTVVFKRLSDIGYHRARVSLVSDYDKAIGGLSWILSRFDKREKRPVRPWFIQDGFRETGSKPKTTKEKVEECEVIIKTLDQLRSEVLIPVSSLMVVDFFAIDRVLIWILPKFHVLEGNGHFFKYYQYVLMSPLQEEDELDEEERTKPTLVTMFRRALYMPNKMRLSQAKHCDMFDYSIVLDKKVTPRQILAEYITYSRTGVRTYPLVFDKLLHEDLTSDTADPFDLTPNVYQVLEELSNKIFDSYDEAALDALDTAMRSLRVHSFGSRLREMHMRCVEEYHKLQKVQKSHDELNAIYEKTQAENYDISPFIVFAKMSNLVNFTRERGLKISQIMVSDYEDYHVKINRLQSRKYCPFRREECDKLRNASDTCLARINALRRYYTRMETDVAELETLLLDFNAAPEKPVKYSPKNETFVDQITCGELGLWAHRVDVCAQRTDKNEMASDDPAIAELRNSYVAFMSDARICIADMERKAYLLQKRRHQMTAQLEKLQGDLLTEQLRAVNYDNVLELLRRLNTGITEYRDLVNASERASPRFTHNTPAPPRPAK